MLPNPLAQPSASSKFPTPPALFWAGLATVAIGGTSIYALRQFQSASSPAQPPPTVEAQIQTVTALGRLEPAGEILQLSAPTSGEGNRIEQLLVGEGDRVKAGQIVAILDSRDRLQAALEQAQAQGSTAEAKLAQVKAGAKSGEIQAQTARFQRNRAELEGQISTQRATIASLEAQLQGERQAQQATIARIQAEFRNAQTNCQRYQMLAGEGAVSVQERDHNCLTAQTTQAQLQEAQANLTRIVTTKQEQIKEARANLNRTVATTQDQIAESKATLNAVAEVRPVDVQVAEGELQAARAAVQKAQADLDLAYVRSPQDGQILEIHTRPGELVSASEGIADIGKTSQMYAIAEVYQSDISKIRLGQAVTVTSDSIQGDLQGTVEQIGMQVRRQDVINADPTANIDSRIVEVKVRLDEPSSQKAAGFTNLQVKVAIAL